MFSLFRKGRLKRLPPDAGIAIAPILFVIALLALLATVIAAGTGDFSTATSADRTYNDINSQANLVRTKINECNLKYGTNNNGDGYPAADPINGTPVCALACLGDPATPETGSDCQGTADHRAKSLERHSTGTIAAADQRFQPMVLY